MEQKYKKIAITGANSFLGTNVVLNLVQSGVGVRAIVRRSNATLDNCEGVEIVKGNVLNFDDLEHCAQGCDAIIHIAAITDQSLLKLKDYTDFNVGALQNVIAVARHTGIKRVVFVSSANTIGNGTKSQDADESTPLNGAYCKQLYGLSKVEAERVLRDATDIDGVIVNPCFMLGAYDSKPSSGVMIMMGYGKRVVFATPGGKNIVDVDAAAKAICKAVEVGRAGENYLLAGQNITIINFFKLLNKISGRKSLILTAPRFLFVWLGFFGDFLRLLGVKTQISSTNMKIICTKEYYSGAKAERELSMPKTSVENCTKRAIEWFKSQGML